MTTPTTDTPTRRPALLGQTVVVIGGSSGIGLETARQARAEGAELVLVGLHRGRLEQAAAELTMTTHVLEGTPDQPVADVGAREAAHTRELAEQGHILRLWRPPVTDQEQPRRHPDSSFAGRDRFG